MADYRAAFGPSSAKDSTIEKRIKAIAGERALHTDEAVIGPACLLIRSPAATGSQGRRLAGGLKTTALIHF
jgi:hypothetical protein